MRIFINESTLMELAPIMNVDQILVEGFYAEQNPAVNMVFAVQQLLMNESIKPDLYIIGRTIGRFAHDDMLGWLKQQLPEITSDHVIFAYPNITLADAVYTVTRKEVGSGDILIDDFIGNLSVWSELGGVGVLFRNKHKCLSYDGIKIYCDEDADTTVSRIIKVIDGVKNNTLDSHRELTRESFLHMVDEYMENNTIGWRYDETEQAWLDDLFVYSPNDKLTDHDIKLIFQSDDPEMVFYDLIESNYQSEMDLRIEEIHSKLRKHFANLGGAFAADEHGEFLDQDVELMFCELEWSGYFRICIPDDYLNQQVYVDIMVDTGDSDHCFSDNASYPFFESNQDEQIPHTASLVWLARTQGYSKKKLDASLKKPVPDNAFGFLPSVRQEIANLGSGVGILTFLAVMTIREVFELNTMMRNKSEHPNATVKIDKAATTGLYDPWTGAGSLMDIQLRNDVFVPVKYIYWAKPDCASNAYTIKEVYGMNLSAWWKSGCVANW